MWQWRKGTTVIVGDSMLARLRESKLSRSKRIKVCYFPGGKTKDVQYHQISYLKKEPDNIIIHIGTNDSPYKMEDFIYKELVNVKETINKFHPNCKNIVISSLTVRTDKEVNNILQKYTNILKQEERNVIFHNDILASHLHRDGLHLNLNGLIMLAGNLLSRILTFRYNVDSNKETNLSISHNDDNIISLSNYKSLINDNSTIQLDSVNSVFKNLRSNHSQQIIIGYLNIILLETNFT